MSLLAARSLCQGPKLRVGGAHISHDLDTTHFRFMHHFPNNVDPMALSNAMARVELSSDGSAQGRSSPGPYGNPPDEFPDLLATRLGRASRFDPSRNRFANALKRAPPGQIAMPTLQITGAKFSQAATQPYSPSAETRPAVTVPIPKASQRLKLRQPLLLPTLRTGTSANDQYMNTRATAIRLGHARNACLARASDAFRRGDGAAAKRFSREGRSLNERMLSETLEAAQTLVKERRKEAQAAVRERDPNWSNDPSDRSQRGKDCGGGLGVVMGVASSRSVPGGDILSVEERTEVLLDLHTLHGPEGAEILSQFLQELDRENFRGLAFVVVGDEKHVGTQDAGRGASKVRLGTSVKIWLTEYGYAWNEAGGVICVDPARYW